ncbi:ABC transporter ATP-binding protein [Pararhodobacter oceanensis]|uniref:Multidrug ABC transporter ATP-binding protein n=1 Tax=Pararhodobacter oceanensis TaxID=2172121 RepID=A0A2T8HSJ0_9RHOB|nr:ABC transporter ATP-binding protein [Pararhodobacter oceanensis]PVH28385.1 multidrug ABC transporter ATP-binding protein [Pararhodobacter oceanensis]
MYKFFENLVDPYTDYVEEDTPPRRLWPFLRRYMVPFRKVFIVTGIFSVITAFVEIGFLWYLGRVVDLLEGSGIDGFWAENGVELMIAALILLTLRPLFQVINVGLLNNAVLPNFGTLIRWRAHRHVLRQSVGWFENDFAGRIANRIMQTPPAAGEAVFQIFDALGFSLAYIIGAAVLLMGADLRLVLPLLVWLALYLALIRWTIVRVGPASKAASDARSAVTGRVVDAYTNIHSVKLFAQADHENDYAREAIENARVTFQKEMRIFTTMDLSLVLLNGFLIVSVVGWAILLWSTQSATLGIVAAAASLVLRLNAMTGWIMWAVSSFFRNLGVVAEGMETIAQPVELVDAPEAKPLEFRAGEIAFRDVSHHYGRGSGGLQHVTLTIAPGEKVGLVGRSGAGKSTLVKLLLRFYDVEHGRIEIDGQDIAQVTQDSLRARIGMVQQDTSLLHRSVRENILYGSPEAGDAQMLDASKRAEAHEFIETLSDAEGRTGYDARVGERGVKLSGGQRQRIAIARVVMKDAPILVLDEATSALDSEVEAQIQSTLYGMMEGKTVIAIAHRLSTIARMDRIVVLDDGGIVEDGTHNDLMAQNGLYAAFWARQSGGFIGTDEAAE